MYSLLVEIGNLDKLSDLEPARTRLITASLHKKLAEQGATVVLRAGNYVLFHFDDIQLEEYRRMLIGALQIRDLLSEAREELLGFALLLEICDEDSSTETFDALRNTIQTTTHNESLYIGENAWYSIESFANGEQDGSCWLITDNRNARTKQQPALIAHGAQEQAVNTIVGIIDPMLDGQKQPKPVLVCGVKQAGPIHTVKAALAILGKSDKQSSCLFRVDNGSDHLRPFIESIDSSLLSTIGEHLSREEAAVWNRELPLFEMIHRFPGNRGLYDNFAMKFYRGYSLYLRAILRRNRFASGPTVMILDDAHTMSAKTAERVSVLLSELPEELRPLIVATAPGPISLRRFGLPNPIIVKIPTVDLDLHVAIEGLDSTERDMLFVITLLNGAVGVETFHTIMSDLGYKRHYIPHIIDTLKAMGLLRHDSTHIVPYLNIQTVQRSILEERVGKLVRAIADWFYQAWLDGTVPISTDCLRIIEYGHDVSQSLKTLSSLLQQILDSRDLEQARHLLYTEPPMIHWIEGAQETRQLQAIFFANRMRLAALDGNIGKQEEVYSYRTNIRNCGEYEGYALLECARYRFGTGEYDAAVRAIKRAIVIFQETHCERGITRAYTDYVFYLLSRERIGDAEWYISMIWQMQRDTALSYEHIRSSALASVMSFLQGGFTRTLTLCTLVLDQADRLGSREWQIFANFIGARTRFELGQYEQAGSLFSDTLGEARTERLSDASSIIGIWLSRTMSYIGNSRDAIDRLSADASNPEALYFLAEAYERMGELDSALECLNRLLAWDRKPPVHTLEPIDWSSGMGNIEDLIVGCRDGKTVLYRLAGSLRGYILVKLGKIKAGTNEMYHLIRTEKISIHDPYSWFYLFLYSQILAISPSAHFGDSLTVLGRAVKHLQARIQHIDRYEDKKSYLKCNYWVAKLIEQARSHGLF